jgi:hypothetical protein
MNDEPPGHSCPADCRVTGVVGDKERERETRNLPPMPTVESVQDSSLLKGVIGSGLRENAKPNKISQGEGGIFIPMIV